MLSFDNFIAEGLFLVAYALRIDIDALVLDVVQQCRRLRLVVVEHD